MQSLGTVLVTGSSGNIGKVTVAGLKRDGWTVVGLDRSADVSGCDRFHQGSIVDEMLLGTATAGCDAIIHLAGNAGYHSDFLTRLIEPNVVAVWRVYAAAAKNSVRRVIFASSVHTVMGAIGSAARPAGADLIDPGEPYGLTKVFGEDIASYFHRHHQITSVCARIVLFPRRPEDAIRHTGDPSGIPNLSHDDWQRFVAKALAAEVGRAVVYAQSLPRDGIWQLDPDAARREIGFESQDLWPAGYPKAFAEALDDGVRHPPAQTFPRRAPPTGDPQRVLITGAAGAIGSWLTGNLRRLGWQVVGFDRTVDGGDCDAWYQGDIVDRALVDQAIRGCGVVIHLAANPQPSTSFNDLVEPNIRGLWTVLEAARDGGTQRVILASSVHACLGPVTRQLSRIGVDVVDPANAYGLTKIFAERAGCLFHRLAGLDVIALRFGWFLRNAEEVGTIMTRGSKGGYLSWDDCLRCVEAALRVPSPGFAIVNAFSLPTEPPGRFDLESGGRSIGYQPRDRWPEGLPERLRRVAEAAAQAGRHSSD